MPREVGPVVNYTAIENAQYLVAEAVQAGESVQNLPPAIQQALDAALEAVGVGDLKSFAILLSQKYGGPNQPLQGLSSSQIATMLTEFSGFLPTVNGVLTSSVQSTLTGDAAFLTNFPGAAQVLAADYNSLQSDLAAGNASAVQRDIINVSNDVPAVASEVSGSGPGGIPYQGAIQDFETYFNPGTTLVTAATNNAMVASTIGNTLDPLETQLSNLLYSISTP